MLCYLFYCMSNRELTHCLLWGCMSFLEWGAHICCCLCGDFDCWLFGNKRYFHYSVLPQFCNMRYEENKGSPKVHCCGIAIIYAVVFNCVYSLGTMCIFWEYKATVKLVASRACFHIPQSSVSESALLLRLLLTVTSLEWRLSDPRLASMSCGAQVP